MGNCAARKNAETKNDATKNAAAKNAMIVSVASPSFSKNVALRTELCASFGQVLFNETGTYWSKETLVSALQESDGVIVGLDSITAEMLNNTPRLKVIAKYGVGLDGIDLEALEKHQINLGWTAGLNRRSVAELSVCFMLGLCRKVFQTSLQLKQGHWQREGGFELSGKTVGIIGLGNIGKDLCTLLKPFSCTLLCNDVVDINGYCQQHDLEVCSKQEIYRRADIISIHTPLTDLTRGMISESELTQMKSSAFLINTSRGAVVDSVALRNALQHHVISGAALDVYCEEPFKDSALLEMNNFIGTPHIGGNANEAVLSMGRSAIAHLRRNLL